MTLLGRSGASPLGRCLAALRAPIGSRSRAEAGETVHPGFVEIDLVRHKGGNASAEYCFTLTVTDIATGRTVNRSVRNTGEKWVFEALMQVRHNNDGAHVERKMPIIRMNARFKRVHPSAKSRQMLPLTGQLETLALAKKPATAKPPVNRTISR